MVPQLYPKCFRYRGKKPHGRSQLVSGRHAALAGAQVNHYQVDIQYLHCMPVSVVAGIKKIPLVITWHEVWGDYWSEYLGAPGYFGKKMEKLTALLSGTMVAVSEMTGNDLHALNNQADITIIPNGIDLSRIAAISPSDTISDLLFSGRLLKEKNIDLLIRALAIIRRDKSFVFQPGSSVTLDEWNAFPKYDAYQVVPIGVKECE